MHSSNPQLPPADPYRGRFAPSPTGPLHFGSLVAAVGSYLYTRQAGGEWLLRIEDLDTPREVPGSADLIIRTLDAFGFEWTGSILRQSSRREAYEAATQQLLNNGQAFVCSCSRSELQAAQSTAKGLFDTDELRYPGWCRSGPRAPERKTAVRLFVPLGETAVTDLLQGRFTVDVSAEVGDFVIRRRDGIHAYQLAVVVDDAFQGISAVVRGADLLHSTPRQVILQRMLNLPTPVYAHLPVATDVNGIKLSKSAGAAAIDITRPTYELWRALEFLQQAPPPELRRAGLATLWEWSIKHWQPQRLNGLRQAAIRAGREDGLT
ncbi:tRNA glutamyl-Q(34) synthetase GluQRS [Steroidobacter gossypii]|uniref:tRNA glutamyl-Q(34) synthetase GluQRS n=1 Tax=Steroidobacter gossypii TaxID=2805490 RepID=UPI00389A23BB